MKVHIAVNVETRQMISSEVTREYVAAKNLENMIREITMKASPYNLPIGMTKTV